MKHRDFLKCLVSVVLIATVLLVSVTQLCLKAQTFQEAVACRVRNSTDQYVPNNVHSKVGLNMVDFCYGATLDDSSIIILQTGIYHVEGMVRFEAGVGIVRQLILRFNPAGEYGNFMAVSSSAPQPPPQTTNLYTGTIFALSAGDKISLWVYQDDSDSLKILVPVQPGSAYSPVLAVYLVGGVSTGGLPTTDSTPTTTSMGLTVTSSSMTEYTTTSTTTNSTTSRREPNTRY